MFGDPLGGLADALAGARSGRPASRPKPLPQIRGKRIGGVLYVRAGDVADALESQVPTAAARLIAKLRRS